MLKAAATGAPALLRQARRGVSSLPIDQNPGQWSVSIKMLEINNFRVCPWSRPRGWERGGAWERFLSKDYFYRRAEERRRRERNVSLGSHWCIFRVTSLRHGTTSRREETWFFRMKIPRFVTLWNPVAEIRLNSRRIFCRYLVNFVKKY